MATQTVTGSETSTYSAVEHLKNVMTNIGIEIGMLKSRSTSVHCDFDMDALLVDISLLTLNNCVSRIALQYFEDGELLQEYAYSIAGQITEWGPPPGEVAFTDIPGCRLRIVVEPSDQPESYVEAWFSRLGWLSAESLSFPEDGRETEIGNFTSGGWGVSRSYRLHPRFDQPISAAGKEYSR